MTNNTGNQKPTETNELYIDALNIVSNDKNRSFDSCHSSDLNELDDNIRNAIALRQKKSKVSDFYLRLAELKDRIEVYQKMFLSRKPKFLSLYQHHHSL